MSTARALLNRQKTVAAGVVTVMVLLGAVLYPSLPDQMAVHWSASGEADGMAPKPIAVGAMPALVVFMSVLFAATDVSADDRVVGSVAMLLLLVVQIMVLSTNLGIDVPIVPVALAGAFVVVSLAVWFELRNPGT